MTREHLETLPPKTSSNSSVPPSSDRKGDSQNTRRKKRGAKYGHAGKSRVRIEPAVFIECKLEVCPDCGADLQDVEKAEATLDDLLEWEVCGVNAQRLQRR